MENNNMNNTNETITRCIYCDANITSEMLENDDATMIQGGDYCCHSCLEDRCFYSEEEDEWIDGDEVVEVQGRDGYTIYVSSDYADNNYYYDNDYQQYFESDDMGFYTASGDWICRDNYYEHYFTCEHCGEIFYSDDACYSEERDCYYCEDCYNAIGADLIYGYHHFSDWEPIALEIEDPDYYIGMELEIDNDSDQNIREVHDLITSNIPSVLMHDGSLSNRGIEIVTQPLSYNYIVSKENDYRNVFKKLREEYNYTSHDNGRCGLHFHFTRPSDEAVDRCILILENFKDELYAFSRRKDLHWCEFISNKVDTRKSEEVKSIEYIKKHKGNFDRYMALNNTNRNTIEFRLMRGTLNYETFRASIDLLNTIYNIACDTSIDLTTITWSNLVDRAGDYVKEYCISKGIQSTAKIIDNSAKLVERAKRVEEYKIKVDKLLANYSKYSIKKYNEKIGMITPENIVTASMMLDSLRSDASTLANWVRCDYLENIDGLLYDLQQVGWRITSKYYYSRYKRLVKEGERICAL